MTSKTNFSVQQIELNPRDLDLLKESMDEIEDMIVNNPFSKNIRFLFENRDFALKPVKNRYDIVKPPNCIGTALFVAGVSELNYPYHAYENELDRHMKNPAYNGNILPGIFNFSYSVEQDDWHAGIYLGKLSDTMVFFAQNGSGGNFCIESLINYVSPSFYIPETLVK